MITLPVIVQASGISGKKVFVRGDIDVPLEVRDERLDIGDDARLKDIWPTVEFLLKQNCTVVMAGHLGRPEGKVVAELSSKPVAEWFKSYISNASDKSYKSDGSDVSDIDLGFIKGYKVSERLTVLENLRFDPREEENDEGFAKELAGLADIFVNESFAESYKLPASLAVAKLLPHFAGFRLAKEVEVLSNVLENPKRPLLVIIAGAKLDTKLPVISKMAEVADEVVVGGKLLTEIKIGSDLMKNAKVRFLKLTENEKDTTLESIDKYLVSSVSYLGDGGTIVWNGPVGVIEEISYQVGTRRLAELIASAKSYKVVGGGDTVGFLDKLGLTEKFDWVSSGGGSMLKFLAGEDLPGIKVLLN